MNRLFVSFKSFIGSSEYSKKCTYYKFRVIIAFFLHHIRALIHYWKREYVYAKTLDMNNFRNIQRNLNAITEHHKPNRWIDKR